MKKIYLSIDLDYWDCGNIKSALHFFSSLSDLDRQVMLTIRHDQIKPYINHIAPDTILHVDYHADLFDTKNHDKIVSKKEIDNSNAFFLNEIDSMRNKSLVWYHPFNTYEYMRGVSLKSDNPLKNNEYSQVLFVGGLPRIHSLLTNKQYSIEGISISMSPDYCGLDSAASYLMHIFFEKYYRDWREKDTEIYDISQLPAPEFIHTSMLDKNILYEKALAVYNNLHKSEKNKLPTNIGYLIPDYMEGRIIDKFSIKNAKTVYQYEDSVKEEIVFRPKM